jgi:hypothetical protein
LGIGGCIWHVAVVVECRGASSSVARVVIGDVACRFREMQIPRFVLDLELQFVGGQ